MSFIIAAALFAALSVVPAAMTQNAWAEYTYIAEGISCEPNYTLVLGDELRLDFPGEFLNYGGNAYEEALIEQLADGARSMEGINYLTITVDGEIRALTEGRTVYRMDLTEQQKDVTG